MCLCRIVAACQPRSVCGYTHHTNAHNTHHTHRHTHTRAVSVVGAVWGDASFLALHNADLSSICATDSATASVCPALARVSPQRLVKGARTVAPGRVLASWASVSVCINVHTSTCVYACVCVCVRMRVCVCVCVCVSSRLSHCTLVGCVDSLSVVRVSIASFR